MNVIKNILGKDVNSRNERLMGGNCECGECESCLAELDRIEKSNKRLFGNRK